MSRVPLSTLPLRSHSDIRAPVPKTGVSRIRCDRRCPRTWCTAGSRLPLLRSRGHRYVGTERQAVPCATSPVADECPNARRPQNPSAPVSLWSADDRRPWIDLWIIGTAVEFVM